MPSKSFPAYIDTVSGKDVILRRMQKHYNAIRDIKPCVNAGRRKSKRKANKHINNLQKSTFKKVKKRQTDRDLFGFEMVNKTFTTICKIHRNKGPVTTDVSEPKTRGAIMGLKEARLRKSKVQEQQHRIELDKMEDYVAHIFSETERKKNQFDHQGNPVKLFRRTPSTLSQFECLAGSCRKLGQRSLITIASPTKRKRTKYNNFFNAPMVNTWQDYRNTSEFEGGGPVSVRSPKGYKKCGVSPFHRAGKCAGRTSTSRDTTTTSRKKKKRLRPSSARTRAKSSAIHQPPKRTRPESARRPSMMKDRLTGISEIKEKLIAKIISERLCNEEDLIELFKESLSKDSEAMITGHLLPMIAGLCEHLQVNFRRIEEWRLEQELVNAKNEAGTSSPSPHFDSLKDLDDVLNAYAEVDSSKME
eukprot:TRINITY_DN628_c0_g1_i3.p1 TRINITY_DN628_c0_g1~~TRINITY_DN628_c0_g1_i3.p1  ORF type:complete len:417 (-),score=66.50 TRINITY_DN628_c0_g1_i3:218-1468(-)